jgi:hypothetical protein
MTSTHDVTEHVLTFFIFTVVINIPLKGRRGECAGLLSHGIRDCFLNYSL